VSVLSAGTGAVCGGITAATLAGLRGYDRGPVHVLVSDGRQVRAVPGTRIHRTPVLPSEHVLSLVPPHTTMARAVVDAAAWAARDDDARAVVDAYWAEWRVHVEIDGAFHLEVRTWWADMRRQNELWVQGDRVLRFPAWAVAHQPEEVATQIRAALRAAGWVG
jgi:hypothetical protein